MGLHLMMLVTGRMYSLRGLPKAYPMGLQPVTEGIWSGLMGEDYAS